MKKILKFILSLILIISFVSVETVFAASANSITLGDFNVTDKKFSNATGTDSGSYQSVVIMITSDNKCTITLPTVTGYEYKSDLSTDYSKVVNLSSGKTAKSIAEEYIRNIIFTNTEIEDVNISISLSSSPTNYKTFYFEGNDHYFQYVPFSGTKLDWIASYNAAKNLNYQGRSGYLATITSLEEDLFIYNASGGSVGWLGGTTLNSTGGKNGNYYNGFETSGTNNWYWACGPEIGQQFYTTYCNKVLKDLGQTLSEIHQTNFNLCYHNWSFEGSGNSASDSNNGEPNSTGDETCLTTLPFGYGYATDSYLTRGGIYPGPGGSDNCYGTYSWNNIPYNGGSLGDAWLPKGYVVEFGNQLNGNTDVGDISANFLSSNGTVHNHSFTGIYVKYDDVNNLWGRQCSCGEVEKTNPRTGTIIPTPSNRIVYTGSEITALTNGTGYTVSGTTSATDIGEYVATITLEAGYVWSDGTTDPKEIRWRILDPSALDPGSSGHSSGYSIPNTSVK